ncbi:TauD/TfdA dioxygenase family protein [Gloeobacter violaceus]|uniref:Gll2680 protein n=1 Tax=Gloeobacter violaceus (strain ATCC 29082 / PCC 7421) TaxID=251221 RepID=Q7NH57_GLOVI|nr:TauD/TfdA family dioxygenase [Gloeobacter violaceus]BAC90621.1 gll2680 [Gloeobacter violaceus PCC 7421]
MSTTALFSVTRLAPHLGAEITGLDLSRPTVPKTLALIRYALVEHQLLVFPGQTLTPIQQIALSRAFGEVEIFSPHPATADFPEIFPVSNDPRRGHPDVGRYWHHDGSFRKQATRLSFFYFREASEWVGDFLFSNSYLAYESLDRDVQQSFEPLITVHSNGVRHALVPTHPLTGRKLLYINLGLTAGVVGMAKQDYIKLAGFINRHLSRPEFTLRHKPRPGDLILCDNHSVAHNATYAPPDQLQLQHRTTVYGTVEF